MNPSARARARRGVGRDSHWQEPAQARGAAVRRRRPTGAAAGRQGLWRAAIYNPMHIYRLTYNLTVSRSAACLNNCSQHGACSADGLCHCEGDWRAPARQHVPPATPLERGGCTGVADVQARFAAPPDTWSGAQPARSAQLCCSCAAVSGVGRAGRAATARCRSPATASRARGGRSPCAAPPAQPRARSMTEPQHAALVSTTSVARQRDMYPVVSCAL
jgi:hypothetical protein